MVDAPKVRGHLVGIGDVLEAVFGIEGDEVGAAHKPEGGMVLLLEVGDDGASDAFFAPGFLYDEGGEFAGAVSVGFDLAATDDTAVFIYGYNESPPI